MAADLHHNTSGRQASTSGRQAGHCTPGQRPASCSFHSGLRPPWLLLDQPHAPPAASAPRWQTAPPGGNRHPPVALRALRCQSAPPAASSQRCSAACPGCRRAMAGDLHHSTEGRCAANPGSLHSMTEALSRYPVGNSNTWALLRCLTQKTTRSARKDRLDEYSFARAMAENIHRSPEGRCAANPSRLHTKTDGLHCCPADSSRR